MKIDNQGKPISGPQLRSAEPKPANAGKADKAAAPQDNVSLSTSATATASTEAAFDADKVAAIRQAISEGRFQVRPEAIANGLLSSVRELLGR
ncbi:flagellar biosynthesis anti-sigma factor FlgM [Chitinilyticum litopenaei]|uniref:flagellar biosynthesis anti-sigma factor FlgM n=1 Tax=Chitinilyticum litopenaei TaxID=1121276 RepID=UPI00041A5239|nr:flagellar biosynthesis anti-sigma factor FlgM [Chitinilyticum litopenaei]